MTRTPTSPPRWAVRAAHLVSLVVLPSALWRLPLVFGFSMGALEHGVPIEMPLGERVYILGLSVVTELAALSTLGLVRPWGERFPPRLVLALASFGVVALAVTWGFAFRNFPDVEGLEFSHDAWHVMLVACYMPLLLWAPLLAAVTYDYYRRHARRKARTASGASTAGRPTSQASAPSAGSSGSPTPSESPRAASTTSEIGLMSANPPCGRSVEAADGLRRERGVGDREADLARADVDDRLVGAEVGRRGVLEQPRPPLGRLVSMNLRNLKKLRDGVR